MEPRQRLTTGARYELKRCLIDTGEIEDQWSRNFHFVLQARNRADYVAVRTFPPELAQSAYTHAQQFTQRIQRYLMERGFTERELTTAALSKLPLMETPPAP